MTKNNPRSGGAPTHPIVPDHPAEAFAGTAEAYGRFRVPYPQLLMDHLRTRAGITGEGRLLDLACGTGQVALSFSPYFSEVWALDREAEMLEVGRREATARGFANVLWKEGRAEDLVAPRGAFELITIGNAFHRLHRRLVGRKAMDWLAPGCCLAVLGSSSLWTGKEDWQAIARDLIRSWVPAETVAERRKSDQPRETFEEALRFAGFTEIEERIFPVPHVWSLEDFMGYVFSLSGASERFLGDAAGPLEAELRQALLAHDDTGRYKEVISFFVMVARQPAGSF